MSHILDDLGLLLWGESGEPLGETLRGEKFGVSRPQACRRNGVGDEGGWTYHFALPGQKDEVAGNTVSGYRLNPILISQAHLMGIVMEVWEVKGGWRNGRLVLSKAVADPSSGEILRVEQRGDAPLPSPSLKLPTGECWKIVQ